MQFTVAPDKAGHYIAGSVVGGIAALVAVQTRYAIVAWLAAVLCAAVVGALKEISDWWQNYRAARRGEPPPHGVESADWFATTLGALPVAAPLLLLTLIAIRGA